MADKRSIIGFANLSEENPFCVTVRESLKAAAAQYADLELICRDNQQDSNIALSNIQEFTRIPVDVGIIFHIDQRMNAKLASTLKEQRIPVITIDIPTPLTPFFGINNRRAGTLAGQALAEWIVAHWEGKVDKILVMTEPRVLENVRQRVDAALPYMESVLHYSPDIVFQVDSSNRRDVSTERAHEVLSRWTEFHRIAAVCFNDESAMGFLDAAKALGREQDVAVVGHGAHLAVPEFQNNPDTRFIASIAYYPENYGPALIDLVRRVLNGERLPNETFVDPQLVTRENYETVALNRG